MLIRIKYYTLDDILNFIKKEKLYSEEEVIQSFLKDEIFPKNICYNTCYSLDELENDEYNKWNPISLGVIKNLIIKKENFRQEVNLIIKEYGRK